MMFGRHERDQESIARAIKAAVSDATTATVLASHIEQCKQDKADIKSALAAQDLQRKQMHDANTAAFSRINRLIWLLNGMGIALLFFSSSLGQAILAKITHP